jgi:geranylgeranyl diphosphate synthase type II
MHRAKTGAMLAAASKLGCVLAGAEEEKVAAAQRFGTSLGLQFQIIDDILDVTGDTGELGKPVGSDAQNGKTTFVTLFGLGKAREMARLQTDSAVKALGVFPNSEALEKLVETLYNRTR